MAIDYGSLNKGWVSRRKKVSSPSSVSNGTKVTEIVRKIVVLDSTPSKRKVTEIIDFAPKNTNPFKEKSKTKKAYEAKTNKLRF
jgi:hypothetical protein